MAFSLGNSAHHPLLRPNSPRFCSFTPPVRRNASKKFLTVASLHQGSEEEGPNLGRRALFMVGLAGSSLLSLGVAVAEDLSSDAYRPVSFLRERLRRGGLKEHNPPRVGDLTTGDRRSEVQGRDKATTETQTSENGGRDEVTTYMTDGKNSAATKGQDAEIEKISREMPSSTRNVTDVNQETLSSTQNMTDLNQEMPSSTQNQIEINKEMPPSTRNQIEINKEMASSTQNPSEEIRQEEPSVNLSLSILNTVGIIGSGVLGALYMISQKDKAATQSTVDLMKSQLEEKEAAKRLVEKNAEKRMLTEQEEHRKQIRNLREGEAAVLNQLVSANATISALGRELRSEKNALEELNVQLDQLHARLAQAGEEKRELEGNLKEQMDEIDVLQDRVSLLGFNIKDKDRGIEELSSSLAEKRSECEKLNYVLSKTKDNYENSCSSLEMLKMEIDQTKKELSSKNSKIDELNGKIKLVLAERDNANDDIVALQEQYTNLQKTLAEKAEMDLKLLSEKDDQLQQLEEKLDLSLKEVKDKQALAVTVTKEKDNFEAALKEEVKNVKNLQDKCQLMQASLEASELEASKLSKLLKESTNKCEDLKSEVSRVHNESSGVQKSLIASLNEAQDASEKLSNELATTKEDLNTATQELLTVTSELKAALEACEKLKAEVLEANLKAEATTHELEKERDIVAKLDEELERSCKQIGELLEAKKTLESYVVKASESLDEMNNKALLLSQELQNVQSMNVGLEKEKEMLHDSLVEQKNATIETLEKIEDAQNVILKLGAERESLANKSERLEEELASAKGEILRLRRQSSPRGTSLNDDHTIANGVEASNTPVGIKRTGGRRKRGDQISQ